MEENQAVSQKSINTWGAEVEKEPVSPGHWLWIPCNNLAPSEPEAAEWHLD